MHPARLISVVLFSATLFAQGSLTSTGSVEINGQPHPYTIRHLPVAAFPSLPAPIAQALTARNCSIPQTYEAHGPENVIHGSFERPGSDDWAILCSSEGTVSLLVFFASAPETPAALNSAPETARLDPLPRGTGYGFNWAIDPAAPTRVHEAQNGLRPHPPSPDHDALADSRIEHGTQYRYYTNGEWTTLPLPN